MSLIRSIGKTILGSPMLLAAAARLRVDDAVVLAYHNIVPDDFDSEFGEQPLHLSQSAFFSQVDELRNVFEIVPITSLFQEIPSAGQPRLAVTFDDAYAGVAEIAAPFLDARQIPYCVFVAPGLLGGFTWWDEFLGRRVESSRRMSIRQDALNRLRGDAVAIRAYWCDRSNDAGLPRQLRICTEEQLKALAQLKTATVGSHSWSHRALTTLSDAELSFETVDCAKWIRERCTNSVPVFAYPYGLWDKRVAHAVEKAGFSFGVTIEPRWVRGRGGAFTNVDRFSVASGSDVTALRATIVSRAML